MSTTRLMLRRNVQVSPEHGEWRHTTLDVCHVNLGQLIRQGWQVYGSAAGPERDTPARHTASHAITRTELFHVQRKGSPMLARSEVLGRVLRELVEKLDEIGPVVTITLSTETDGEELDGPA